MMAHKSWRLGAAGLCAAAIGAVGQAQAQSPVALEEVVVTVQKRPERGLEVPIALSVITAPRLEQLGVRDLADVARFTPGLIVQDQSVNNPGFAIRGITSDNAVAFEEPRVSLFQDGVSISKTQASFVELFDIERIEVAKGPQSTLYGRSALIGAINIIQQKPTFGGLGGYARGEMGGDGYRLAQGAVNLPLSEKLAVRLAGSLRKRDGAVENALGGPAFQSIDTWALRGSVGYRPTERFEGTIIVNFQKDSPTGSAFKSHNFYPTNPITGQVLGGLEPWGPAALAAPADFEGGIGLDERRKVGGVTALNTYKLSDTLTLHSITAWRGFKSTDPFDADGTSLPLLTGVAFTRGDQWSQELRVNYEGEGRLRGFIGGSFFRNSDEQRVPLQFDERVSLAQLTGQLGFGQPANTPAPLGVFANTALTGQLLRGLVFAQSGNRILLSPAQAGAIAANLLPGHVEQNYLSSQITSADIFGDATYKVTDRFEVTGGLRYSRARQITGFGASVRERSILGGAVGAAGLAATGTPAGLAQANAILAGLAAPPAFQGALPLFGLADQPTTGNGGVFKAKDKDGGFTWRMTARYEPSDQASLYASYARGRRPPVQSAGGPRLPNGAPSLGVVPAEKVDSYEVGAKGAFLDRRLSADVSAFTYRYNHFQTVEQQGVRFVATDAGRARSYGVEAQVAFNPVEALELYATYAYNHARLKSGAYAGNHFRLSPDHAASFSAVWRIPALGGELRVVPSYSWQSKVFFSDNNDRPEFQQPPNALVADNVQDEFQKGFGRADLRVSWSPPGGRASIEVFATNLFDKKYIIDAGNTGDSFGLPTFVAGRPRLVGAGLTYRFD